MQPWKLWGLGVLLAMGMGCERFFSVDGFSGRCQPDSCPPGKRCIEVAGGVACEEGAILQGEGCRVGDRSCPQGHVCEGLGGHMQPGAEGECREGCHMGEDGCGDNLFCVGSKGAKPGAFGQCSQSEEPQCRVGDARCNSGHVCVGTSSSRLNAPGTCQKETLGNPCNTDGECAFGSVCEPQGGSGVCIPGERSKGLVVATLKSFQLLQNDNLLAPWQVDGAEANMHPGVIAENAAATVRVLTQGPPGANPSMALWVDDSPACASANSVCEAGLCTWSCTLPAPWPGTQGVSRLVGLRLQLGGEEGQSHTWTFHVAPLHVLFLVAGDALLGDPLQLCVASRAENSPSEAFQPRLLSMRIREIEGQTAPLNWVATTQTPSRICHEAPLPPSLGTGRRSLAVEVEIEDATGERVQVEETTSVTLTRTECHSSVDLEGSTVEQPLAFVNRRLAFGAGNHLYVANCASANRLATGSVSGPMVVLGDTGQMAVAIDTLLEVSRLFMVNAASAQPAFAQNTDCVVGSADGTNAFTVFSQGLSLLSLQNSATNTPWRLVAPANTPLQHRLMAYVPGAPTAAERCLSSNAVLFPFLIPTAQRHNGNVVNIVNGYIEEWQFDGTWTGPLPLADRLLFPVAFFSIADNPPDIYDFILTGNENLSAGAVDADGYHYAISHMGGGNHQLRRYNLRTWATQSSTHTFSSPAVGSPLLGEPLPNSPPEVYVLSSAGVLLAFNANTLELLWTEDLALSGVSERAQPLLVANENGSGTLWVVGRQGELRGIRVGSSGLHRTAHWPKALRDNCNTSSRQVNYDEVDAVQRPMRVCF